MTTTASWIGLCASLAPAGKPDLRDTSTSTQSTTGKKARTAFDGPGTTSTVTLAVKPRQRYVRGHGITVTNSATSRGDAEKRFGMRWSRI